nr:hAT dimerization domain, ribonuclease H-like domain protein [Tanacetum cinerariifolium]
MVINEEWSSYREDDTMKAKFVKEKIVNDEWNPNDDVKMWDVGGDAFDSMEDVGFLEFANLSLDEPEFENDLIIDN